MTSRTHALNAPFLPLQAISSALIAALISFGGTVALIVQAGQATGGSPLQIGSAVTALCLGVAVTGATLALWLRMPVVLGWSTPGAALIAASTLEIEFANAIGAFVAAAGLMVLLGLIPALGRLAARIPMSIAAAMLAGVLLPFCLGLFRTIQSDALLGGALLILFVVARQRLPTYALLIVLAAAVAIIVMRGQADVAGGATMFGTLVLTAPVFDWKAAVSLGVPLFLVTLVSQNLPGFVVLRSAGYNPPPQPILFATGLTTLALAPFGAHGVNLAAITAAICTGPDAHPDPNRRYAVSLAYAVIYVLLALFSAPLVGLFVALPPETIAAITGVALIGPLANALGGMLSVPDDREAAVLTFAATASGVALFGIGSAFWGLIVGFLALGAKSLLRRPPTTAAAG